VQPIVDAASTPLTVFFGTGGRGEGIHTFAMDPATGALTKVALAPIARPGWVTLDPWQRYLYAAIGGSQVASFAVDARKGTLTHLNSQPTATGGFAHIAVDPSGTYLVGASWGAGTVGVLPIRPNGSLGTSTQTIQHTGAPGPHADQTQARAHQSPFDPSGRWVLVTDLGLDRLYVYGNDPVTGKLTPNNPAFAQFARGRGPRHMAFHPNGRLLYIINELDSTMTALTWDAGAGIAQEVQTLSSLPDGWTGRKWSAQVVVHPSGRWVYGSNRGSGGDSDDIAIFAIDEETGRMAPAGHVGSGGKVPRNFNIDPSGTFMICVHQDSDNVVTFWIDPNNGMLIPTGQSLQVTNAICTQFAPSVGLSG